MTSQSLPERPNLEQLKKQAKSLLHAAQATDPAALARFLTLPAFAGKTPATLDADALALHDAQSVIAREHGFASWRALREQVEERTLTFAAALEEFVRCATGGAPDRARRLLSLHPGIARATLQSALVLGDATTVEALLTDQPDLATRRGGPQDWEPLLYVCHTCLCRDASERGAGLVAIARRLLALGANPRATYSWKWHEELPRTALWGALYGTAHLPLAEALLAAGADPTDGVSLHIASGSGHLEICELLLRHGANVDGIPGGLPPLRYILGWATDAAGPRWLLEHGADANLAWGELGDTPLHVAAQRWDVPLVEELVHRGADIHRRRTDGRTAHTLAELHGNHDVAAWLLAHGAKDELSPLERFIAACAGDNRARATELLAARPALRLELQGEHHLMLQAPAERGAAAVLETMLACGFDPNVKDASGVTALHRAAMAGRADAVRVLLARGAEVNALDGMFSATPLVWAAEGWSNGPHAGADHLAVARQLIAAGSRLEWSAPEAAPSPERTHDLLLEFRRAAVSGEKD